jgi:TPR repeat protein
MTNPHDDKAVEKGGGSSEFIRAAVIAVALMLLLGCRLLLGCSETDRIRIRAYIGDSEAQFRLALVYFLGEEVPRDDAQAVEWFRKAAEQGNPDAQFGLGLLYRDGERGVPRDDAQAVEWFRKAAEQGYADAQFGLGLMYDMGEGVSEDDAQAVEWYRKAAEQGYAKAQYLLGMMHAAGTGAPKDLVIAHKWANLAASSGEKGAHEYLASLERNMTEEQRAEAEKLAREWFEAHRVEKEGRRRGKHKESVMPEANERIERLE